MAFSALSNIRHFIKQIQDSREIQLEQEKSNPYLMQALETEKQDGHRVAFIARTIALSVIALVLPIINPRIDVLFYEFLLVLFIGIGWLQYRMAQTGISRRELLLIMVDLALMTVIFVVPNPFLPEAIPSAFVYQFNSFIYFFVILAVATLAYSWRTVWAMGTWVTVLWSLGLIAVTYFGKDIPELTDKVQQAFSGYPILAEELDPNSFQLPSRIQEMVVFVVVAGILAAKGWRSNQLLLRQAAIASERANLSRYFPASIVDVLASTQHDIGAVRSQNVAVLFTDIVGFTKFAETNTPKDVMEMLRGYHAFIERSIFQNNGTLDKYLGDGVMATFGTPETRQEDTLNALNAARQILEETKIFNAQRLAEGKSQIEVSVGAHYGPVILGDIGPSRRLEFAVVGDTVNVASRLESSSRELHCQCVVSDDLMKHAVQDESANTEVKSIFKEKDGVLLRGRQSPINVWIA